MRPIRVLAALVLILLLTAEADAGSVIRVGTLQSASNLPLYCMLEHGAPATDGIDVQLVNISSGARIVEALGGGSLDIGYSATLSILQAAHQGLDLVIVAPASFMPQAGEPPTGALVVRKDSGITSAAHLRGKTIGVVSLRGSDYLYVAEYLAREGVSTRDVTWQEIGYPHMAVALEARRLDAVRQIEPFLTLLREAGSISILSMGQEFGAGLSVTAYTALRSWTKARPKELEAFLRSMRRGLAACQREPVRMRQALRKYTGLKGDVAERVALPPFRPTIGAADVVPLQQLARRHGLLEREVPIERLLLPDSPR